ncbi:Polygalacturonase [Bienertia sinuspersici]
MTLSNLFLLLLISSLFPHSLQYTINPTIDSTLSHTLLSSSLLSSTSSVQKFINVKNFGAKNDGEKDATPAFLNAWNVACNSIVPSIIYVPKGKYLLKPLKFEGICKNSNIIFQIDGTLIAPNDYSEVAMSHSWIVFHMIDGLQIKGGVLDGKGKYLWDCKASHQCHMGAKSLSFDNSKNIVVDGLTSMDSQMFHITINACQDIKMTRMKIFAHADSPNTDGIHIAQSTGITIINSDFRTGDDCISIGPNTRNLWIEGIYCGPGHGISIGSLGRESDEGVVVQNVTVKSVTFRGTDNGFRIKTFSTPINGKVKDVFFLGARMIDVRNPIIIDQNYCPHNSCPDGQGSKIQISKIVYKDIRGTSSSETALIFDCSPKKPCMGLTLQDIKLTYQNKIPQCQYENAYGQVFGFMQPSKCFIH